MGLLSGPASGIGVPLGAAGSQCRPQLRLLISVDFTAGQPRVQDPGRVSSAFPQLVTASPGGTSGQGVDTPGKQPDKGDHHDPHKCNFPDGPAASVPIPEHHHDHLPPARKLRAALSFTVGVPGTYRYLCPVPGHAQKGMTGTFTVSA
jgi:hypothetical protein